MGNLDALELVFRLISSGAHLEVRTRALRCVQASKFDLVFGELRTYGRLVVQELLAANPLNAVSFRKSNGFSYMLQTVADVKLPWVLDLIVHTS